eukprot:Rmarinus@m.9358
MVVVVGGEGTVVVVIVVVVVPVIVVVVKVLGTTVVVTLAVLSTRLTSTTQSETNGPNDVYRCLSGKGLLSFRPRLVTLKALLLWILLISPHHIIKLLTMKSLSPNTDF